MIDCEFLQQQLQTIEDPDLHISIVDLGLIYAIEAKKNEIFVTMTLTSPACPMGDALLAAVEQVIAAIYPDVKINVSLVWDPPWHRDMITELGKMELGML
ncbi:MAG: metal-sulfur cluster assembly factor [Puniceicoccales bacterium]|jgi:metal-sulfur cluster biosynthetic enzyme|nr:metal-sulfur cluster assembly factor [Puniceicoccales bacterium]